MSDGAKRPRRASIATRRGDAGETGLAGGGRASKGDARVEAYGAIDETNAAIGLARAWCEDAEIRGVLRAIQRDLFAVGAAVSTKPAAREPAPEIGPDAAARLDALVARFEAEPGALHDWALPGEHRVSAALDLARTVARRAERAAVRCVTNGNAVPPAALAYLNRLSDVLWAAARVLEARAGLDARLRDGAHPGPPWSRAW